MGTVRVAVIEQHIKVVPSLFCLQYSPVDAVTALLKLAVLLCPVGRAVRTIVACHFGCPLCPVSRKPF
jgi:hypothetical protein